MFKIRQAILKELRLLQRDLLGVAIIFLMPIVLVITITFIQHSVENGGGAIELPILLSNNDDGELAQTVISNLQESGNLKVITNIDEQKVTNESGKELIKKGKQKILIVIPENFSNAIQTQTDQHVANLLTQVIPDYELKENQIVESSREIRIYFDPTVDANVRNSLKTAIESMISKMETKAIYRTFETEFEADFSEITDQELISFKEESIHTNKESITPNAVQHNLPAWALFAIFFIVLPLSINIVKEKNQGTFIRLKTLPVSPIQLIISKIIVYLFVCMIQFYLMLAVSMYLFPLIGLPALNINGHFVMLSLVAFFSALAAIGFGVAIGTFSKTHEQAAPFGATSVVILAAIGGLWFPVYAMPETMQWVARISPLNWGLESFYTVLLRDAEFSLLFPYLLLLLSFFIVNMLIALIYEKKNSQL